MNYQFQSINIFNNRQNSFPVIIFILNEHDGGLCDFLKFCLHAIYLCHKYNKNIKIHVNTYLYNFIDINNNFILNKYELNELQGIINDTTYYLKSYNIKKYNISEIFKLHNKKYLLVQPPDFFTCKNINFELPVDLNFKDYFTNNKMNNYFNILDFINFKEKIYHKYFQLINDLKITQYNYICIHLRCGDKYLEVKPLSGYCINDVRLKNIQEYIDKITNIVQESNIPILFICDNNVVKNIIKQRFDNVIIINSQIIHVGYKYNNDSNIDIGFQDTLVDFLLLMYSKINYALSYSGFSILSSMLTNKNLISL
jgi:hypothetical protein